MRSKRLFTALVLGVGLTMALLWLLNGAGMELLTARAADLHVCPSGCAYSSVQAAVDAASAGDVIKVATGTYTGVSTRAGVTQVVYIDKGITIRGGYSTAFTEPPDPEANPTTLDAQQQGRVLYVTGKISPTVEGLLITGGHVKASGGGIYAGDADLALVRTVISDNTSDGTNWPDGLGGGVYIRDGSVTFSGGQVVSNTASYKGGGVCVWNGRVTLNGVRVINNIANGPTFWDGGGGVWVLGSATFSGGQIISNTAVFGGGLYVYLSDVTASGAQITGNSTPGGSGGGVLIWPGGRMTLNGGEISDNFAAGTGGGLLIWSGGGATLNRVDISNNSAGSGGGGVYSDGTFTLTNSVVSDNRADMGSGLYIEGDSSRISHTTIVRNLGSEGSGVHVAGSAIVTMTNTILAVHTVGITVTAGSTAALESTLWHDNSTDWGGPGTIKHSDDHAGDPAFNAPGAGDYHIGSGSAAIDAGVDAGVRDDMDGDIRPFDGDADGIDGFDIGADEYVRWHVYLPLVLKNP